MSLFDECKNIRNHEYSLLMRRPQVWRDYVTCCIRELFFFVFYFHFARHLIARHCTLWVMKSIPCVYHVDVTWKVIEVSRSTPGQCDACTRSAGEWTHAMEQPDEREHFPRGKVVNTVRRRFASIVATWRNKLYFDTWRTKMIEWERDPVLYTKKHSQGTLFYTSWDSIYPPGRWWSRCTECRNFSSDSCSSQSRSQHCWRLVTWHPSTRNNEWWTASVEATTWTDTSGRTFLEWKQQNHLSLR